MSFVPLFCPNPECAHHQRRFPLAAGEPPWFRIKGRFATERNGEVQRYQCKHCGRTFSQRSGRFRLGSRCGSFIGGSGTGRTDCGRWTGRMCLARHNPWGGCGRESPRGR